MSDQDGNNCTGCMSGGKTRINVNIWGSQYDMDTFMGRVRHYYKLYSPCHFFASELKLENARKIVERYRCGDPMNDVSLSQLWKQKYIYESTFDRYSDDKEILLGRPAAFVPLSALIGGAMLTYHQSVPPIMFWQWAYQTFQLGINHAERPPTSAVTDSDLLMGYGAGTLTAITTALLYHKILKCHAPIIASMGPAVAVTAATIVSVPVTRYRDLTEGIPIYDEKERQLGYSTKAATHAVVTDIGRHLLVSVPPLLLSPFFIEYLDERGTLCRYPYLKLPSQMLFIGLFSTFLTPILRGLLPEKGSMAFESLQPEFQDFGDTSQESIPCDGETNGLTQEASCSSQVDINVINNDVSSVVSTELAETVTPARKRMKVLKKDDSLKPLEDAVQVLRTITSKKEDDELDTFMKSIVSQMRKLPEEHNIRLMSDIQSLVSERRTEHLKELKSQAVSASGSQFFINVPPNVPHESLSFFYEDSSKIID